MLHSIITVPLAEARKTLGDIVGRVSYGNEHFVITRNGKSVAGMVPLQDIELLQMLKDHADLEAARAACRDGAHEGTFSLDEVVRELGL